MRVQTIRSPKTPFVAEERALPVPGRGEVRVRVRACGVCHSDQLVVDGLWPGLRLPRVPGHEIAGTIDAVGDGVGNFRAGARVGVGWHGGHDGTCDACLAGKHMNCVAAQVTGISYDGGYAEYVVVPSVAVARIPDGMDFADAAPLMCAGVTTFNALRNSGARPGDLVAVQGLGGLGHLGVQFARAMGFDVAAISRGADKEEFARELGARHYVDAAKGSAAEQLRELGGARVVLATAPHASAISELVPGLGIDGCLMVVAAAFQPLTIGALDLIAHNARVQGWQAGTAADANDAVAFAQRMGVRAVIEKFPFAEAARAYRRMISGEARFRALLVMD